MQINQLIIQKYKQQILAIKAELWILLKIDMYLELHPDCLSKTLTIVDYNVLLAVQKATFQLNSINQFFF